MQLAKCTCSFACFAVLALGSMLALAQDYPAKPVRMIVAYPAGSGIDSSARFFAAKFAPLLGQTVYVENRPGASGIVGTEAAAKAAPDGYTLYMTAVTPILLLPYLVAKLPYDINRDFVPITVVGVSQTGIMVNPSLPAKDLRELIELSKKEPLNAATVGVGSNLHLYGEWFSSLTGARFTYIAYNTAAPLNDLVAGHTQVMFDALAAAVGLVKSGKLKLLALTGKARQPAFPDVPTFAEYGLGEFEPLAWGGLLAPAGTPAAIVERLNRELVRIVNLPDVRAKLVGMGNDIVGNSPAAFAAEIRADVARWGPVMHAAGIRGE